MFFLANANALYDDENTLFIEGSSSVAKLIEISEDIFYEKTGVRILIRALGSDKGIISQAKDLSDIAVISRFLTKHEQEKWPQLEQLTFAQDAIIFIVNKNNPETSLTMLQIQNIYTQNTPKWPNSHKSIKVLAKDIGHGTHDSFLEF
jgi:phosphate transport system substrate-binding protein